MTHAGGSDDIPSTTTPDRERPSSRSARRRIVVALTVAFMTAGLGLRLAGSTGSPEEAGGVVVDRQSSVAPVDASSRQLKTAEPTLGNESPSGSVPSPKPRPEPEPELEPEPEVEAEPEAGPAAFEIPTAVLLPTNVFSGGFVITNIGGEPFDWTAFNFVGTQVLTPAGSLEPGEQATINFTVDHADLEDGPFPEFTGVEVDVAGVGAKQVRVKGLKLTTIVSPA